MDYAPVKWLPNMLGHPVISMNDDQMCASTSAETACNGNVHQPNVSAFVYIKGKIARLRYFDGSRVPIIPQECECRISRILPLDGNTLPWKMLASTINSLPLAAWAHVQGYG